MAKRPHQEEFERDILDIIPERYDSDDEDDEHEESGGKLRTILTVVVALIAVGGIVVFGWRFMSTRHMAAVGPQVIKADDKPIKVRPDDRGGMDVPNQDKLVYGRMENEGGDPNTKSERLLAPPEEPMSPQKPGATMAPEPRPAPATQMAPAQMAPSMQMAEPAPVAPKAQPSKPSKAQPTLADAMAEPKAPASPTTAPVTKASAKPADGSATYLVQLGSVRSADAADKEWARIQKTYSDLLSGLKSDIVQVELPDKGTYWRIRAGMLSKDDADKLCKQLSQHNQGCLLAHK